jgi:hypothetical protein
MERKDKNKMAPIFQIPDLSLPLPKNSPLAPIGKTRTNSKSAAFPANKQLLLEGNDQNFPVVVKY